MIPRPVIGLLADILPDHYTHAELDTLFMQANAPGDAPDGNKEVKCQQWLSRTNSDTSVDALNVLGSIIENLMERDVEYNNELREKDRIRILEALGKYALSYSRGKISKIGSTGAIRTLDDILKKRDLNALETEFDRALESIESDPPASLTAACAILESLFKVCMEDNNLPPPSKSSIKPLWNIIANHLGFDPKNIEDADLLRILSGMNSIVDGVGALRTHAGSAHGRGRLRYNIKPRHARLAVLSAHTLAVFILETWMEKNNHQKHTL